MRRAVGAVVERMERRFMLAAGELDATFGDGGASLFGTAGPSSDTIGDVVRMADGRYIAVGATNNAGDSDFALTRFNADGSPDETFGVGGRVTTHVGKDDGATVVTALPDGSLVVGGYVGISMAVARYDPDGSLDESFGHGGIVVEPPAHFYDTSVDDLAVDAEGRVIVVAGRSNSALVLRYDAGGSRDTSFSADGLVTLGTNTSNGETFGAVALGPDGKLVVGATGDTTSYQYTQWSLWRLNADGSLDGGFAEGGHLRAIVTRPREPLKDLAVHGDAIVAVGGGWNAPMTVLRVTAEGELDTNFGTDGVSSLPLPMRFQPTSVTGDAGGHLLIGGGASATPTGQFITDWRPAVVRLTPTGALDSTFDADGLATTSALRPDGKLLVSRNFVEHADGSIVIGGATFSDGQYDLALTRFDAEGREDAGFVHPLGFVGYATESGADVVVQPDGKIVSVGASRGYSSEAGEILVWRHNPDGTPDPSFGVGGHVKIDFGPASRATSSAVRLLPDGRILVGGTALTRSGTTSDADAILVRLLGDGRPDPSFGNEGRARFHWGKETATDIALQPDGKVVLVGGGATTLGSSDQIFAARVNDNGTSDTTFGTAGRVLMTPYHTVSSAAVQSDGKLVLAGPFGLIRLNADGTRDNTFGGGLQTTFPNFADVLVDAANRIYAVDKGFAVTRYTSGGIVDTTFGQNGKTSAPYSGASNTYGTVDVTLDAAGRVVVGGGLQSSSSNHIAGSTAVARFLPNGAIDWSFGSGGKRSIKVSDPYEPSFAGLALEADGDLIVLDHEFTGAGQNVDLSLVRLQGGTALSGDPGGPYTVVAGRTIALVGSAATDSKYWISSYQWDLDYGGDASSFSPDASGSRATFSAASIVGPAMRTIALRVKDSGGNSVVVPTTVTVVPPRAEVRFAGGPAPEPDGRYTISLDYGDDTRDPIAAVTIDWGDGSVEQIDGKPATASHVYAPGRAQHEVKVRVRSAGGSYDAVGGVREEAAFDPAFGDGGVSRTDFATDAQVVDAIVDADGRYLVVSGDRLLRYRADGTLDATFGDGGSAPLDFSGHSLVIQADGQILVGGSLLTLHGGDWGAVARFRADGSRDVDFGTNGFGLTSFSGSYPTTRVAVLADGRILLTGARLYQSSSAVAVLRQDGIIDRGFGTNGQVEVSFGQYLTMYDAALAPDGRLAILGGLGDGTVELRLLRPDGKPDTAFDGDGAIGFRLGTQDDVVRSVAFQADGKLLLAGRVAGAAYSGGADGVVARLNADGTFDASFGTGGKTTFSFDGTQEIFYDVTTDPGGRIVVGGTAEGFANKLSLVARFLPDGAPDTSFGDGGAFAIDASPTGTEVMTTVVALPSGQVLAAGHAAYGADNDHVMARFGDARLLVSVGNDAPSIAADDLVFAPAAPGEMQTFTLNGTFEDADASDAHTVTIDWGDGSPATVIQLPAGQTSFSADHVAPDDKPAGSPDIGRLVTVSVSDGLATASAAKRLTIGENLPPIVDLGPDLVSGEHVQLTVGSTITDAAGETFTYQWGIVRDGATPVTIVTNQNGPTLNWRPGAVGRYTITLTVRDDGQVAGTDSLVVDVMDQAPVAGIEDVVTVDETMASPLVSTWYAEPVTYAWRVLDASGNVVGTSANSGYHFRAADNGQYTAELTVTDNEGNRSTTTKSFTVLNTPPVAAVTSAGQSAREGAPLALNATWTDPGRADTHTVLWKVKDPAGRTVHTSSEATLSYVPLDSGWHTVTLTVTDDDAGSDTEFVPVNVGNVAPQVTLGSDPILEGTPYTLAWTVADPGADTITSWTIDWGDGTAPHVLEGSARSAIHTYPDGHKQVTIKVTAVDEDGTHVVTSQRSVLNVQPLVTIDAPETIEKGKPYVLNLSATDPGADRITRWTINWGDGTSPTNVNVPANAPTTAVSVSHTYAGTGRYEVSIRTTDEDGMSPAIVRELLITGGTPFTFADNNVRLWDDAVDEGWKGQLSVWVGGDPDMYELTLDWGDGSPPVKTAMPRGTSSVNLEHYYADDPKGPDDRYEIVATLDNGRETKTVRKHITVTNVSPYVNGAPDDVSIVETTSIKLTAPPVTDNSSLDVITYWWEIADEGGKIIASGPGKELTFTATDDGVYNAALFVYDDDGGNRWLPFVITASNVRPTLSARASNALVHHGETLTLDFSASGDIGPDTIASWAIDWGDGSPVQTLPGDARSASHVYTSGDGLLPIVVRATDEDGTYGVPMSGVSAAGTPDTSFAGSGKTMLSVSGHGYVAANDIVIRPDGKAVVVAAARDASGAADAILLRYNADGTLDRAFGTDGDGIVRVRLNQRHSEGLGVAIAPDGKIVMAGRTWAAGDAERRAFVARFDADGTPDLSFGGNGEGRTSPLPETIQVRRIEVLPDGRILFGVRQHSLAGVDEIGIVRLSANGTVDASFGRGGFASVGMANTSVLSNFEVARDGRIVVSHHSINGGAISRLNADGSRDWSFGYGGRFDFGGTWRYDDPVAVEVLPDSRILVAAHQFDQLIVARLENHGVPDVTFGDGGRVVVPLGNNMRLVPSSMVLDDGGRPIIAGTVTPYGSIGQSFGVLRLTPDGLIDPTFGPDAPVTTRFTQTGFERAAAIAIDGDRIWGVGTSASEPDSSATTASLVAARFLNGAIAVRPRQLDVSVGGNATVGIGTPLARSGSVTVTPGSTLTATVDYGDGGGEQPLALNPDNTFSLSHQYQGIGTYAVRVRVSHGSGGGSPVVATFDVSVRDASFVGTVGDDTFHVRLSRDGSFVEFFENEAPTGAPTFVLPVERAPEIVVRPGFGRDRLVIESGSFVVSGVSRAMDNLTLVLNGDAAVTLAQEDRSVYRVELEDNASLTLGPGTTSIGLGGITIADNGTLDLRGGAIRIAGWGDFAAPSYVATLEEWVRSARDDGEARWSGPGITSSSAAGDDQLGVVVTTAGKDYIVAHSYNGDANADGRINADDYFRIDSGFLDQPANPLYGQGDFNLDDRINADDYFLIDSAFLGQGTPTSVLEPLVGTSATAPSASASERRDSRNSLFSGSRIRTPRRRG